MNTLKIKEIIPYVFCGGLGFAISSILGLDGLRDTMQMPQLLIGGFVIVLAAVLHLGINKR